MEQLTTFVAITFVTILFTSLLVMMFIYSGLLILINRKSPARGDQDRGRTAGGADLGDRALRNAIGADLPRPARQAVWRLNEPHEWIG